MLVILAQGNPAWPEPFGKAGKALLGVTTEYIGAILGLYWGYIGIILGLYWGYIGVILGLY